MAILQQGLYMNNEKIILSLGTNIGSKTDNLKKALQYLNANGVTIKKISPIYKTKPLEYDKQEDFLNMAATCETSLSPFELLKRIKLIEKEIGRKKTILKGPRKIDIDIIFYGSVIMHTATLVIPHISYKKRLFVLKPMSDIEPEFIPPMETVSILQLANTCEDKISNPVKISG